VRSFRCAPFRWLWCSTLATYAGTGIHRTATAWLALDAGPFAVGLVLAAGMVPNLLFGLAGGTLADRVQRKRLIASVSLATIPIMLAFSWIARGSSPAIWQLVALAFLIGSLNVVDIPARQALVMESVPPPLAANAMSLNALATRLCMALGALLAGVMIATVGTSTCYLVVVGTSLLSVACVLSVRPLTPRSVEPGAERVGFLQAIRDGARLVVDIPKVRTLVTASIACEVLGFSFMTAVPVFARDVLDAGAEGLGTLNASASIGGSVAMVLLSLIPARIPREPMLGAIFATFGLALIGLASSHTLPAAAVALLVIGGCAACFDVLQQTLMQLAVPEHQRGRAVGLWVLGIGSAPAGHLEMGSLAASFGAPIGLLINGCLVLVAAGVLLVRAPQFRSLKIDVIR
jgi:MFS family permease